MTDEPSAPSPFDAIRQGDPEQGEYWSARDLAKLLGYRNWQNFQVAVERAITACTHSGHDPADHFIATSKMIRAGKGAQRRIADWHLSRYACYLVAQNADSAKPIVALGQTYFAVQTRRQEAADALAGLTEAQQRLYLHGLLTDQTAALARTAQGAGVRRADDFAIFQDHGYQGLYGGWGPTRCGSAGSSRSRRRWKITWAPPSSPPTSSGRPRPMRSCNATACRTRRRPMRRTMPWAGRCERRLAGWGVRCRRSCPRRRRAFTS